MLECLVFEKNVGMFVFKHDTHDLIEEKNKDCMMRHHFFLFVLHSIWT
jgi:hypothetical protein